MANQEEHNNHEELEGYHCAGCGVALQSEVKEKAGYVPASAFNNEHIICQRCFRIKHYNEAAAVEMNDDDFLKILHTISEKKALIVYLVDMFDVNGSWISGIAKFAGKNPVLLVGNKVDLLPQNMNMNRMRNWLQKSAKEMGLKPLDIIFCSAIKGLGVEKLLDAVEDYRKGKDVFIVGATNVGKSSLLNRILKQVGVEEEQFVTTSRFPGTTLDLIEIPLQDGQALYDTPGIINRHQMAHYVTEQDLKVISPLKRIKPMVYQLNDQQTLFFGGLARLDFIKGERQSFVCYMSNALNIHRTKLEKADQLYQNQLGEILTPPHKEQVEAWSKLVKHSFKIGSDPTDVVFSGLGWVTIKSKGAIVEAYAPKGVAVTLRPALI